MSFYLRIMISRMFKRYFLFFFISIAVPFLLFPSDDGNSLSPEEYEENLFSDIESLSEIELRENYISIAEICQVRGELQKASEYFEKASLTVKGDKDFMSLYRSALLETEMAHYRNAETKLRAILTFSDDPLLRIKSATLTARIKISQDLTDEGYSILKNIFAETQKLPVETIYLASDFYKRYNEKMDLSELKSFIEKNQSTLNSEYMEISPILNPDLVFSQFDLAMPDIYKQNDETEPEADEPAYIQLGSFSVKENADDMLKTLIIKGYEAVIKIKKVNGKDYYAVAIMVDQSDEIQNLIITLKESGFEGYPVY